LPKPEPVRDPGVEIRDSPVHGKGVFATRWFKPGELIGIYEGTLVVDSSDPHVLWLEDEEGRYFGILASGAMGYLNCCASEGSNNAVLSANSPFIYARMNILPGDEIFISYNYEVDDDEEEGEEE
jgi:hypothetical protein